MTEVAGAVDPAVLEAVVRTVRRDWFDWAMLAGSVGVTVGTLLLALSTRKMARASKDQLDWYRGRDRAERTPRVFMKDIWVKRAPGPAGPDGVWQINLVTKGMANMGAYAVAIHDVYIADATMEPIVRAYPMLVVGAGDALAPPVGTNEREVELVVMQRMNRARMLPPEVDDRAAMLVIEFRYGSDVSQVWELRLPRRRDTGDWLRFSGATELPRRKTEPEPNDEEAA